jgi:hypothetical protein
MRRLSGTDSLFSAGLDQPSPIEDPFGLTADRSSFEPAYAFPASGPE